MSGKTRIKFSLYLLKQTKRTTEKEKFFRYLKEEVQSNPNLKVYFLDKEKIKGIRGKPKKQGEIYLLKKEVSIPPWVEHLNTLSKKTISSESDYVKEKAILFIQSNNRTLAISFGNGVSMIDEEYIEHDFGLEVSKKMLKVNKLGGIDSLIVGESFLNTKKQSNRTIPMKHLFDKDSYRIVKNISGKTESGFYLDGGKSIFFSGEINVLDELVGVIDSFTNIYLDNSNESMDLETNIDRVTDTKVKNDLDKELTEKISKIKEHFASKKDLDENILANIDFAPRIIDAENFEGYIITGIGIQSKVTVLDKYNYFLKLARHLIKKDFQDPSKIIEKLKRDRIYEYFENETEHHGSSSVYSNLTFELTKKKYKYVLLFGDWYRIDIDFYSQLQREMDEIPTYQSTTVDFSTFNNQDKKDNGHKSEGLYNDRIANSHSHVDEFDKNNYPIPKELIKKHHFDGRSVVEPCDLLYTEEGNTKFVHIKRLTNAAGVSHLLAQANASSTLLLNDGAFVDHINENIKYGEKLTKPVKTDDVEIVLGFIVNEAQYKKKNSNLFSLLRMLTISNTLTALQDLGFKVSMLKIKDIG